MSSSSTQRSLSAKSAWIFGDSTSMVQATRPLTASVAIKMKNTRIDAGDAVEPMLR